MATYEGYTVTTRTFKVTDPKSFEDELHRFNIEEGDFDSEITFTKEEDGSYWVGGYNAGFNVWRSEQGKTEDEVIEGMIDIVDIVQKHMTADSVWIYQHVGHEKLRDVSGYVEVVTKDKRQGNNLDNMALSLLPREDEKLRQQFWSQVEPTIKGQADAIARLLNLVPPGRLEEWLQAFHDSACVLGVQV